MGTRNLTIVVLDGKTVVGQYCQWDGYPSGQGATILAFLRDKFDRTKFLEGLKATRIIESDEHNALYEQILGYIPGDFIDIGDSKKFGMFYPSLNRDLGGKILEFIQEREIPIDQVDYSVSFKTTTVVVKATPEIPLSNQSDFLSCSSCEWAYKIDLDTNKLTVYSGGMDVTKVVAVFPLGRLPNERSFLKKLGG